MPAIAQLGARAAAGAKRRARLRQLFHDSDEDNLRRNPIQGVFRGDYRYAAHLGDYITDAYFAAERAAAERELAALRAIDRNALNATDRIAYDVFKWQRENDLADVQPAMLALTAVRPINHFSGFHTFYPVFASGRGAAPFRNVEDYDNNCAPPRTHRRFAIGRFRRAASGAVEIAYDRNVTSSSTQLRAPKARLITSRCSISRRSARPTGAAAHGRRAVRDRSSATGGSRFPPERLLPRARRRRLQHARRRSAPAAILENTTPPLNR